jgi:hypothetical protein
MKYIAFVSLGMFIAFIILSLFTLAEKSNVYELTCTDQAGKV